MIPGQKLLTRSEVAELFGVSPSTITRWADEGKLPTTKTLGGHRRYAADAVKVLAQQLPTLLAEETPTMTDVVLSIPAMWADHHVLAVRQALLALPGVEEVQASSAFKTVKVAFDANKMTAQDVVVALEHAGYQPSLPGGTGQAELSQVPVSTGKTDPAWGALKMRAIQTNPADMAMSGEFRKY